MNRDNISVLQTAYPNQSLTAALSAPANKQLLINSIAAVNGSAADMDIAIGHSINNSEWEVLVTDNSVETDVTTAIQAGTATSVIGTTNNDQFIVQAKEKFGFIAFDVSQAQAGSPVYTYTYYNGSSFVTLTLISSVSYAATGVQIALFLPPVDWTADADGFYAIRVRATTAPSQAVQIDSMKVCRVLAYREEIQSKGQLQVLFELPKQLLLQAGEEIVPYFSFSNASNIIEASYQISP